MVRGMVVTIGFIENSFASDAIVKYVISQTIVMEKKVDFNKCSPSIVFVIIQRDLKVEKFK